MTEPGVRTEMRRGAVSVEGAVTPLVAPAAVTAPPVDERAAV